MLKIHLILSTVTRIVRVISQLRGNMLLVGVGASGRQSMSKMAAFICEYQVFQVEVTKHYRKQEFREGELKKRTKMCSHIFFNTITSSFPNFSYLQYLQD